MAASEEDARDVFRAARLALSMDLFVSSEFWEWVWSPHRCHLIETAPLEVFSLPDQDLGSLWEVSREWLDANPHGPIASCHAVAILALLVEDGVIDPGLAADRVEALLLYAMEDSQGAECRTALERLGAGLDDEVDLSKIAERFREFSRSIFPRM